MQNNSNGEVIGSCSDVFRRGLNPILSETRNVVYVMDPLVGMGQ